MRNYLLFLTGGIFLLTTAAYAQEYHYSYGTSRVVNQNQTGLSNPSSTYIGPGTLSQTARGENPNAQPNGLPQVNMGANIRTPGDNVYTPGAIQYQGRGANRRRVYNNNQNQGQQQQGHLYVPGQNAGANSVQTYGQSTGAPTTYYAGPSSYTSGQTKGTRGF